MYILYTNIYKHIQIYTNDTNVYKYIQAIYRIHTRYIQDIYKIPGGGGPDRPRGAGQGPARALRGRAGPPPPCMF